MHTWLLFDGNNAAHRAHHTTGTLRSGSTNTGILFGMLREIRTVAQRYNTTNIMVFWDYGYGLRKQASPGYKSNRGPQPDWDEAKKLDYAALQEAIIQVRDVWLPQLGFSNVFKAEGYEADDLIAATVRRLPPHCRAVVVSGDEDLYQLLGDRVVQYKPTPKVEYTAASLAAEYEGITPNQWAQVKALAGCKGDCVEGMEGVGEKTACRWLLHTTKPTTKIHQRLAKDAQGFIDRNMPLVSLPYPGTPFTPPKADTITAAKWEGLMRELNITTLEPLLPERMPAGVKTNSSEGSTGSAP
jgi:DNA polymerase-1